MNKQQYDLAFGLGTTCGCSLTLRRARLQYLSFPGDWTAPVWCNDTHPRLQHGLCVRADTFCRGLDGFFVAEDLRFDRTHPWNGKDIYYNERTRYVFNHDFPASGDLSVELPKVLAKYQRRYRRLTELIRSSKRVLVVRIDAPSDKNWPKTSLDDCRQARQRLNETFAPTAFDIALLSYEKGRPYERMADERTDDGIYHFAFDYANPAPGADPLLPDIALTARLFAERFSVRDYRTPAEVAAHKAAAQRKKWAKVGASGPLGYLWKKTKSQFLKALGRRRTDDAQSSK